jgi:hypothetical protein
VDITDLPALIAAHRWPVVAAIVIALIIRLTKGDIASTPTIPARWRSLVSLGLGILSGAASAVIAGTPWGTALLEGLAAGVAPIAGNEAIFEGILGKRTAAIEALKAKARAASASIYRTPPPPPPRMPSGMGPGGFLMVIALLSMSFAGCVAGCAASAPIFDVAAIVLESTTLANAVLSECATFVDSYFAAHPDAAKEAEILSALKRAEAAASALGGLAAATEAVDQGQLVAALADFKSAYSDLLIAIGKLPGAQVVTAVTPGPTQPLAARVDSMTLVVPPPSAFKLGKVKK